METDSCSRMAKECQNCHDRDICNNKRLEAMAYIIPDIKPEIQINISSDFEGEAKRAAERMLRNLNFCKFGELRR